MAPFCVRPLFERLESVLSLVEEVAFHHVDTRIAAFLMKSAKRNQGIVIRTHAEIASELGTSREVVTEILRDLEAEGLIQTLRGKIKILAASDLEKKSGVPQTV